MTSCKNCKYAIKGSDFCQAVVDTDDEDRCYMTDEYIDDGMDDFGGYPDY